MARSRLPLRGIAVFAAVARLGSFKAAANELSLSPSAVSHQIRALEDELGVELFKRLGRGIKLSADAARYAEILDELFERMRRATADVAAPGWSRASTNVVRLMTPPSLATHWLMPRLPAFIEAHPGIDLRVFAVRTADGNADDFDITIRYGAATRWKGRASLLRPSSQRAPQAMVPDKAGLSNACNVHSIAAHRSDGLSQRHHRKRDGGYKQHRLDVRHGLQPRLRKPVVNVVRGRSLAA